MISRSFVGWPAATNTTAPTSTVDVIVIHRFRKGSVRSMSDQGSSSVGVAAAAVSSSEDTPPSVRIREEEIKALRLERESVLNGTHSEYRAAIEPYEGDFGRAELNGTSQLRKWNAALNVTDLCALNLSLSLSLCLPPAPDPLFLRGFSSFDSEPLPRISGQEQRTQF